jgi:hypothetical protein
MLGLLKGPGIQGRFCRKAGLIEHYLQPQAPQEMRGQLDAACSNFSKEWA